MAKLPRLSRQQARELVRWAKKKANQRGDLGLVARAQVISLAGRGRREAEVSEVLSCARSFVYKIIKLFLAGGRRALFDGRSANGPLVVTAELVDCVRGLVWQSPEDYGYIRPTWTRELLVVVAEEQTGIRTSVASMGRLLQRLGIRLKRPKPIVKCRYSNRHKRRLLAKIKRLLTELPENEVAVFEDEADIHLNPKIGLDWMPRGFQKQVVTPGKNEKAYVAGTLDSRNGTVLWVGEAFKNSQLFVMMLDKLDEHYRDAVRIHVILDNYGIHHSRETKAALKRLLRIKLHFLPPYCPDHNRIERLWQDLHANITRNHRHKTLISLCGAVATYLECISPWLPGSPPAWSRIG